MAVPMKRTRSTSAEARNCGRSSVDLRVLPWRMSSMSFVGLTDYSTKKADGAKDNLKHFAPSAYLSTSYPTVPNRFSTSHPIYLDSPPSISPRCQRARCNCLDMHKRNRAESFFPSLPLRWIALPLHPSSPCCTVPPGKAYSKLWHEQTFIRILESLRRRIRLLLRQSPC